MPYLAAAVALVGALCLLNLLLALGIIRRLREHTAQLAIRAQGHGPGKVMLPAGASVGDFAVTTTDGEPLSAELLSGTTLIGFFAHGCDPCHELMPQFITYAAGFAGGRNQVLAVVIGEATDATEMLDALAPVARTVREDPQGPVAKAFGVSAYPALALLDGRVVIASGHELAALPRAVSV